MKNIKDKRVRLLCSVSYRPPGGLSPNRSWFDLGTSAEDVTEWKPLPDGDRVSTAPTRPLWAYFRSLSGSEFYAASAVQAREEVIITVNWQPGIAPSMRVIYKGDMYDITRVDVLEGYKGDVKLYCERVLPG